MSSSIVTNVGGVAMSTVFWHNPPTITVADDNFCGNNYASGVIYKA